MRPWRRWQDWTVLAIGVAVVSSTLGSRAWGLEVAGVLAAVVAAVNLAWPRLTVLEWVQTGCGAGVALLPWLAGSGSLPPIVASIGGITGVLASIRARHLWSSGVECCGGMLIPGGSRWRRRRELRRVIRAARRGGGLPLSHTVQPWGVALASVIHRDELDYCVLYPHTGVVVAHLKEGDVAVYSQFASADRARHSTLRAVW